MVWRRYWKTAAMSAAAEAGENGLVLFKYALRLLRVALLVAVWRAVYAGKGEVGGLVLAEVLTYTLIAEAFQAQLDSRVNLDWSLHDGTVGMHLLRPVGTFADYSAEMVGVWFWDLLRFSLPLLVLAPLLGVDATPASLESGVLFLVSLILAVFVGVCIDLLFACLTVAMSASGALWVVRYMRSGVTTLLSGAFIPLSLMPFGVGRVLGWLPFASMASAPLRIYVGQGEVWPVLVLQMLWVVVGLVALRAAWRVSEPRLVSFGG